jgi:hypothetical protein
MSYNYEGLESCYLTVDQVTEICYLTVDQVTESCCLIVDPETGICNNYIMIVYEETKTIGNLCISIENMQCLITMKAVSICVLQENGFPKEDYN